MADAPQMLGRAIPRPEVNLESQPFWAAAGEGRFLIRRCRACGEAHWYPRTLCPLCHSDDTAWEESPGEGEVYTFSIMRTGAAGPYAVGFVRLDEGPHVLANLVDMAPEALKIGLRVKVRFQPTEGDGPPAPVFAPA